MTKKFAKNIIGLTLITTSMTFATTTTDIDKIEMKKSETLCYTSDCMSTPQLQKEVEKLSIEGKLPFEMGLELMKRWSNQQIS
ncbi:MAG: hypothetical protein EP216_02470 [Epsilonproteobacteria bacterium]|nr:MAG: hypothetical protein EP216_02470 [Campylobacterota bacterium]